MIEQALTGPGRAFAGLPVTRTGYVRQDPDKNSAKGKILIQYTNDQQDEMGDQLFCPQQAIYKVWFEENMVSQHTWAAAGDQIPDSTSNQKRQNGNCTVGKGGSGTTSATGTNTATTANTQPTITGASSGFSTSVISSSNSSNPNTITAGPTTTSSSTSQSPTSSLFCYPFQDPDAGPAAPSCQCDGLTGFFPYISSTSSQSSYNPCGYTTPPTTAAPSSVPGFTTTQSDGEVVSCATSTYYNFAVNTVPSCAGSTQVVSTVASIASVYSASVASAAASASAASASAASAAAYTSAAAVPSAGCWILSDDGFGDSSFEVYGINGWAGDGGSNLWTQEDGCGILSGGEFYTNGESEFDGRMRDTQYAYFGLSFFKGGCVERAVHSAGGPPPGTGPGELACQHTSGLSDDQSDAVGRIAGPQLKAVQAVANSTSTTDTPTNSEKEDMVVQPSTALIASASAALPHLMAAASSASMAPAPTST